MSKYKQIKYSTVASSESGEKLRRTEFRQLGRQLAKKRRERRRKEHEQWVSGKAIAHENKVHKFTSQAILETIRTPKKVPEPPKDFAMQIVDDPSNPPKLRKFAKGISEIKE